MQNENLLSQRSPAQPAVLAASTASQPEPASVLPVFSPEDLALQQRLLEWPQTRDDINLKWNLGKTTPWNEKSAGYASLPLAVWALRDVSLAAKAVLAHLLWRMGPDKCGQLQTSAYPAIRTIATFLGVGKNVVTDAVEELVAKQYLRIRRGSSRRSNSYAATYGLRPCPAKLGDDENPPGCCDFVPSGNARLCPYCQDTNNPCSVIKQFRLVSSPEDTKDGSCPAQRTRMAVRVPTCGTELLKDGEELKEEEKLPPRYLVWVM
jgi:hypothetical protein